jgi:hypothetical protein
VCVCRGGVSGKKKKNDKKQTNTNTTVGIMALPAAPPINTGPHVYGKASRAKSKPLTAGAEPSPGPLLPLLLPQPSCCPPQPRLPS